MATKIRTIKLGDRVRVKNTMLFDDRVGEIIPTSGHPEDIWDWYVTLEPKGLDGSQRIGVMLNQVELLEDETTITEPEGAPMSATTVDTPSAAAPAARRDLKPGIYRGVSPAEFGLWRLTASGIWLFSMPVAGATWKRAADQNPGDKLILLVDETRI